MFLWSFLFSIFRQNKARKLIIFSYLSILLWHGGLLRDVANSALFA